MEQSCQPHYVRIKLEPGEAWPAPVDDKIIVIEKTIGEKTYTAAVYEADTGEDMNYVRCQLLDNPHGPPATGPVKTVKSPELASQSPEIIRLLLCRDTIWEVPRADYDLIPWFRFQDEPPQPEPEPSYQEEFTASQTGPTDEGWDTPAGEDEDQDGFYC